MKPINPFLGRRQFLIAAGVASTCALTCKKIKNFYDHPSFQKSVAIAAEKAGPASGKATINQYNHLLSPLIVRNVVLKNRIMHTPSVPGGLAGAVEVYPEDSVRSYYSEVAKNASLVSLKVEYGEDRWEDVPAVNKIIDQLIEDIHCEGSLICCGRIRGAMRDPRGMGRAADSVNIENIVTEAKKYEDNGYDAMEAGERSWISIEAMRADLKTIEAVRKATNLLIVAVILPYSPGLSRGSIAASPFLPSGNLVTSGPELKEVVAMAKELEGLVDIIRMKDIGHYTNHPNSFTMEKDKPWMLRFAQAIKESGAKIITAPNGGFHDPALNNEWIGRGKTDMVAIATPLIADPEYVKKLYEGRAEDIVPCVMCHDCHGLSTSTGHGVITCNVNPKFGLSETKKRSIRPAFSSRNVAVVGGGPAGMKAAITAAERGHKVTLYDKNGTLGGLLRHTDFTQWRWTYKEFKDYLVRQTYKMGVDVLLNTEITPEMVKAKGYDTVLVATGAEPIVSKIPGGGGENIFDIMSAYENKKSLGKNVVLIGGGVFGTETGICLAKDGYKITLLTSESKFMPDEVIGAHNKWNQIDIALNHKNFSFILEVTPTRISEGNVFYKDTSSGGEKAIQADSVVIYAGLKPRRDEAMKYSGSAGQVLLLGDCTGRAGTLQKTIRSAFFMASQV